MKTYVAHVRKSDGEPQSVKDHLLGVMKLAEGWGKTLGVPHLTGLAGLLHDTGKYSEEFQEYLAFSVANPTDFSRRGTVDHSTAGGKLIYEEFTEETWGKMLAEIVGNSIISHHGGLNDFVDPITAKLPFLKRVKEKEIPEYVQMKKLFFNEIMNYEEFIAYVELAREELQNFFDIGRTQNRNQDQIVHDLNLLMLYTFSCLIDGDRTNTQLFEANQDTISLLDTEKLFTDYALKLEVHLKSFVKEGVEPSPINKLRSKMSLECLEKAEEPSDIYQLSIPTGGGKTLASLRYALRHAKLYGKERIIYVVPFTTIIEQNAETIREILGDEHLLEHHSNVIPDDFSTNNDKDDFEEKNSELKLAKDNWDSPIILTTMVQYLNAFYSKGTRNIRRMHNLTNAIIIFDEVQAVPIKCISMFNQSVNFLRNYGKTSVLLCTATQPALDFVENKLELGSNKEMISNLQEVVSAFKRVRVRYQSTPEPWNVAEISDFSHELMKKSVSLLIILNTKRAVAETYKALCEQIKDATVFHLSTSMCAKHRKEILSKMKEKMENDERVVCVSSQLIEAGVDISFANVIRSVAGMDSIAQAAGRCNRHGEKPMSDVYVIDVSSELEKTDQLVEISEGRDSTKKIIASLKLGTNSDSEEVDLLNPEIMTWYFKDYYEKFGPKVNYFEKDLEKYLYDLSGNSKSSQATYANCGKDYPHFFSSSFKTIGKYFNVIEDITTPVLVPYDEQGEEIIAKLNGTPSSEELTLLLKQSQQYTINVYDKDLKTLDKNGFLLRMFNETGYAIDQRAYNDDFGLDVAGDGKMGSLMM